MKKLILTTEQLEKILFEDSERFVVRENGEWISEGKYEQKLFIFEDIKTGTHYRGWVSRSGSYYSDWTYESEYNNQTETLFPVEEQPVTRIEWVAIDEVTEEIDLSEDDI